MHRKILLTILAIVTGQSALGQDPSWNVLLIITDDMGWADTSVNNPETFYETPALAAFAASGVNYHRGYAAAPVCSPTRVSLMTGLYPARHKTTEWFGSAPRSATYLSADYTRFLPLATTTIAEALRDRAGYQTFYAGKWHLGEGPRYLPAVHGFDKSVAATKSGNPGRDGYFAPYNDVIGIQGPDGEHLPVRLTDETMAWIDARDEDRPFLAVLSYYSVHTPLGGRADLVAKYQQRADAIGYTEDERFGDEERPWGNGGPTRPVRERQDEPVYAAMVEAMDEQIGRVLDHLEEQGLADSTLVIFVSDNGGLSTAEGSPTSNLPLRGGKGWLYEGGLRVPMIVRWPGELAGGRTEKAPVNTNDLAATIVDAAGLGGSFGDGLSLRRRAAIDPNRMTFFHYPHYANQGGFPGGAVIRGDDKLIQRYEDGRVHLYDVASDPGEQTDLAGSQPRVVNELRAALHNWLGEMDADFLHARPGGNAPWRPKE